jgi:hypothetical protein
LHLFSGCLLRAQSRQDSSLPPPRHLSGADLGAVLAEAQLVAVHEVLERRASASSEGGGEGDLEEREREVEEEGRLRTSPGGDFGSGVRVLPHHIERALSSVRPSLPVAEQRRLASLHAHFMGGRGGQGGGGPGGVPRGGGADEGSPAAAAVGVGVGSTTLGGRYQPQGLRATQA